MVPFFSNGEKSRHVYPYTFIIKREIEDIPAEDRKYVAI